MNVGPLIGFALFGIIYFGHGLVCLGRGWYRGVGGVRFERSTAPGTFWSAVLLGLFVGLLCFGLALWQWYKLLH